MVEHFQRPITGELKSRIRARGGFVHVLTGPRQVGKTTAAQQICEQLGWPYHFASADSPIPHTAEWIETQWLQASRLASRDEPILLVLDELQKISGWSEMIKSLWDTQRRKKTSNVCPLLLGSSALLLQQGLSESLAGRFMLHRFTHWSFHECRDAFSWNLSKWLYFGGYPGAAPLINDTALWKSYITDSLIDTVISRDVLQMQTVQKPALLRNLFGLSTAYPAQILSYNKMLGQLMDAGNTTTLAHYLQLLNNAFLISGIQRFSRGHVRVRTSSPKLILWNNALVTAPSLLSPSDAQKNTEWWGRLVENAVGAYLLNALQDPLWTVSYWREGNNEVDFIVSHGKQCWAVEVKSGRLGKMNGLAAFMRRYPDAIPIVVGGEELPLESFFAAPVNELFGAGKSISS